MTIYRKAEGVQILNSMFYGCVKNKEPVSILLDSYSNKGTFSA